MKAVFLYAGQGSQKVGMGKDFYDTYDVFADFIDSVDSKVDVDIKKLMFEGPIEELSDTKNTQSCMAAFAAGVTMLLKKNGVEPVATMGLSLGEYGALFAADVIKAEEYVKMTAFRGEAMSEAARGLNCSMSAILGLDAQTVEKACAEYAGDKFVTLTNYNCPGQYVICGDEEAVADTEARLQTMGAKRCVRLNVSGPFHTKFMAPAGEKLAKYFETVEFKTPTIPIALNVTGKLNTEDTDLKKNLVDQVQNGIRIEDDLKTLIAEGYDTFIEIGPGNAVSGFLKKTAKAVGAEITVCSIETVADFEKLVATN